jgi:hypothetical protein
MELTIEQTVNQLKEALISYIEATYHISDPNLIKQRRALLEKEDVISKKPYIESTPRYKTKQAFRDLQLPPEVLEIFSEVSRASGTHKKLIYDPPYEHQALSIQETLNSDKSLFVITGTGSGKTECYFLPILGKLAIEAKNRSRQYKERPAVRALILYPMNALVNDQLGRIRLLFGDPRISRKFMEWSGRPIRFGRYTSRTLYPGIRTSNNDSKKLSPSIEKYYIKYWEDANDPGLPESQRERARKLCGELQKRGKWPQKPDLRAWYGKKNDRWKDSNDVWKRCVTLDDDNELLTRHEIQDAPPDILITNYSMLEYMLMRPIEQSIFNLTSDWLQNNPDERLLLVMDEAHLYRGAGGAEVALLIRRLRARLDIPPERLQVICTSASFSDDKKAPSFGAQLTGVDEENFETIMSNPNKKKNEGEGTADDADALNTVNLEKFYAANPLKKSAEVQKFLEYRSVSFGDSLEVSLYKALEDFPVMKKLINITMGKAQPVDSLGQKLFRDVDKKTSDKALSVLTALASFARESPSEAGLMPCRVHTFFRGLTGLWVCMDADCNQKESEFVDSSCGKLYSQPYKKCDCGARIFELFTCQRCGCAYARAYTDNIAEPQYLWEEPGVDIGQISGGLEPLDLLIDENPRGPVELLEPAEFDLITGRLNPPILGERSRQVYIRNGAWRLEDGDERNRPGQFVQCGNCGEGSRGTFSWVKDHKTKGDQPFQALINKQIKVQPPCKPPTIFSPLAGRKVLVFSDSRQVAARLAPTLTRYSLNEAMRPLIVSGFNRIKKLIPTITLSDWYMALLIETNHFNVNLRPEVGEHESYNSECKMVEKKLSEGVLENREKLAALQLELRSTQPCHDLLQAFFTCLTERNLGIETLALASIVERRDHTESIMDFPDVPGIATTPDQKLGLARAWIRGWQIVNSNFSLPYMSNLWFSEYVKPHSSGNFRHMNKFLGSNQAKNVFKNQWLDLLISLFTQPDGDGSKLKGSELSMSFDEGWAYCDRCRTTQRPFPDSTRCIKCGEDSAQIIDPDNDPTFSAKTAYYRKATVDLLKFNTSPVTLIAAEHTAQLNAPHSDVTFAKSEENELLFQDVDLGLRKNRFAIDLISCTTTMEVGIDIGELSGVSLRNMPPSRSNYQQRAGRAGRRGTSLATVTAFGGDNSHDDQYFKHPEQMISGDVIDPVLILDKIEIIQRHVVAYLLQRYHRFKLMGARPEAHGNLFSVLGTVDEFKDDSSLLNRNDFGTWLAQNETALKEEIDSWLPKELSKDRDNLLKNIRKKTLELIDRSIGVTNENTSAST